MSLPEKRNPCIVQWVFIVTYARHSDIILHHPQIHNYHILAPFTKKKYKVQSTCWEYWSSPIRVSPRLLHAHNLKSLSLPDRLCVPGAPPAAYLEVPLLLLSLVVSSSTLWSSRLLSFPLLSATLFCSGEPRPVAAQGHRRPAETSFSAVVRSALAHFCGDRQELSFCQLSALLFLLPFLVTEGLSPSVKTRGGPEPDLSGWVDLFQSLRLRPHLHMGSSIGGAGGRIFP